MVRNWRGYSLTPVVSASLLMSAESPQYFKFVLLFYAEAICDAGVYTCRGWNLLSCHTGIKLILSHQLMVRKLLWMVK